MTKTIPAQTLASIAEPHAQSMQYVKWDECPECPGRKRVKAELCQKCHTRLRAGQKRSDRALARRLARMHLEHRENQRENEDDNSLMLEAGPGMTKDEFACVLAEVMSSVSG